ncbi:hypothetical protein QVD17_37630 [Tagetes erecta]|uniref:Uncharacterized protein n=1 Tax=Tagetes erecta TaxID=13708 RepID=A0AAD8JYM5_TARER|nr:hypothetical protein QVD17_37630 [Tagetes erecta]
MMITYDPNTYHGFHVHQTHACGEVGPQTLFLCFTPKTFFHKLSNLSYHHIHYSVTKTKTLFVHIINMSFT